MTPRFAPSILLVVLTTGALTSTARADEAADERARKAAAGRAAAAADLRAQEAERPTQRWYGWQILPLDLGSMALGLNRGSLPLFVGTYSLAAPLVHWAHGHRTHAIIGFGLRAVVPLTVGLVADERCQDEVARGEGTGIFACDEQAVLAAFLPALAITLFDTVFSLDEVAPAGRPTASSGSSYSWGLAPRRGGGVELSFGGAF